MYNILNIDASPILAIGDIHGQFNKLVEFIKKYNLEKTCIIICGDCGLGFHSVVGDKNELKKLDTLCKNTENYIVMLRGNHDNPRYFRENLINTEHIIAVPDYTVLNSDILLVGGATSIDRLYRQGVENSYFCEFSKYHPGKSWDDMVDIKGSLYWKDEAPVFDGEAIASMKIDGINISHVCTHTCPSFCEPTTKDGISSFINMDPDLEDDIKNERDVMDKIWNALVTDNHPLKSWTYGHYHRHFKDERDGVKFTMLDAIVNQYSVVDWIPIK